MNVLFICSRNRLRSPTAEAVFSDYPGLQVSSAGTSVDAENPVSRDQVEWADVVFAMEEVHRKKLLEMFPDALKEKKVVALRIPDKYSYMDQELIKVLKQRVSPHLKANR
jgi:predicted protein tyrosine phosphatase